MSNYTKHYQLHQWEPGDAVLRTDFNEDFARLDAAIWRSREDLVPVSRNLYNLLLREHYAGKDTGWKQGLFFEGFAQAPTGTLSNGLYWDRSRRSICSDGHMQEDLDLSYGSTSGTALVSGASASVSWTAPGTGWLDRLELFLVGGVPFHYALTNSYGETVLSGDASADRTVTLSGEHCFLPRGTYTLKLTNKGAYNISMYSCKSGVPFGLKVDMEPMAIGGGSYTVELPHEGLTYRSLRGWIRHDGGLMTLSAQVGGRWQSVPVLAAVPSRTVDGADCTEVSFALDVTDEERQDLRFKMSLSNQQNGILTQLLDYGIALI